MGTGTDSKGIAAAGLCCSSAVSLLGLRYGLHNCSKRPGAYAARAGRDIMAHLNRVGWSGYSVQEFNRFIHPGFRSNRVMENISELVLWETGFGWLLWRVLLVSCHDANHEL
jgi:hypothetical protein